jgi:hypothetical protein
MITNINDLDLEKTYSYADYLTWKFQERLELIRGEIFKMSPAPSTFHQKIASNLHGLLWYEFKNHTCKLFSAPFDVRLVDKKNLPPIKRFLQLYNQICVCFVMKIN